MHIAVVGSGYVGLVAAACFAELGHEVASIDNDVAKIGALQRGEVPIHEEFLPELLHRHHGQRLRFSTDLEQGVSDSQAVFIAVGTPSTAAGDADLSYVESVARSVARTIRQYTIIVEKSTVPVFTNDWIARVMRLDGAHPGLFDVASNPEFLREGTAVRDFLYPDRIVIGANTERCANVLREIYAPLTSGKYYRLADRIPGPNTARIPPPLIAASAKSAELIKHASNAYLAMKISFINAVANICEAVGADIKEVCQGIGSDSRIGASFLNPGIGYGGSCFPKDLKAFQAVARENGHDLRLLQEVVAINNQQLTRFLRKVRHVLWTLKGKRLAVLGLAFKGGTDDVRESPALEVIKLLVDEGCEIRAFDPAAMEKTKQVLPLPAITYYSSPYEAAKGADALLILTDWPEFAHLDLPRVRELLAYPIVVDGRNLYDPAQMAAQGFIYSSVGRPEVQPAIAQPMEKAATAVKER